MEGIIDVQLVKEQLRLLGHSVADEVIIGFVKGLSKTSAADQNLEKAAAHEVQAAAVSGVHVVRHKGGSNNAGAQPAEAAAAMQRQRQDADAAPSKLQQAPDQQSPKRLVVGTGTSAGAAAVPSDSPPPHSTSQLRPALDQRCRNYLARCADAPSPEQQQQVSLEPATAKQPILLHVPQLQQQGFTGCVASQEQLSSPGSSALLLLDDTGSSDGSSVLADSLDSDDSLPYPELSSRQLLSQAEPQQLAAAARWAARQQPQQQQLQQRQQWQPQLPAGTAHQGSSSGSDEDGMDADGGRSQQVTTMQRVHARLTAALSKDRAGAAADAASAEAVNHQQQQQQQLPSAASILHSKTLGTAALAAAARLGASSSSTSGLTQIQATDGDSNSSELPRFGFRAGYKPVGVHMPPPPSAAAVEALAAARALRQQAVTQAGAAAASALGYAVTAQQGLGAAAYMQAGNPNLHKDSQLQFPQQQQQACRVPMLQMPSSISSSGLLRASPTHCKAPAAAAGAGNRSMGGSIIGGESPCLAAGGSKARQTAKVDPLYLAPSSPKRNSPATPRSSPARSPMPAAALSATALRLSLTRGPPGTAQPAKAVSAGAVRSASSSGGIGSASSRQYAPMSAGGRSSMPGTQQRQQQQHSGLSARRTASAPAAHAEASAHTASRPAAAGHVGSACRSSRRSTVSQESLYCQRLACGSQRGTVAPGVRRTDRVARFQQMQQQWQQDRFLCSGAGGAQKASS